MIGNIYEELLRESIDYGYFKDRSNIPDYDAILFGLNNTLPKKYSNWVGEIKFMSGEEYFRECAKIAGTDVLAQTSPLMIGKIKEIEGRMVNGIRYDLPYLNYIDGNHEGRHRVMAASNLGQGRIPVLVLDYVNDVSDDNKLSDMVNIWDDLVVVGNEYYVSFPISKGYSSKDRLLKCIVSNYDYYYLDGLIDIKLGIYNGVNGYIRDKFKNQRDLYYINIRDIEYTGDGEVSEVILKLCVIYKTMTNNINVINDCFSKDSSMYYLRVLNNIRGDFYEYGSCEEMLLSIGDRYYINEYGLESVDRRIEITEDDVSIINSVLKL